MPKKKSIKSRFTVHLISIQEEWTDEGRQLSEIEINNYTLHHQYNQIGGQKGGLLSIFITPLMIIGPEKYLLLGTFDGLL